MNTYENRYFVKKLNEAFVKRKQRNKLYSLRAFSRDLDVSRSTIHEVLKGKRALPLKNLSSVEKNLLLSPIERELFFSSIHRAKVRLDDVDVSDSLIVQKHIVDDSHYKIIVEWEHYAILTLFDVSNFEGTEDFISTRLGISIKRTQVALLNLVNAGFIRKEEEKYVKTVGPISTSEDVPSKALKEAHREVLKQSEEKLEEVAVEDRDYSTVSFAINKKRLKDAKLMIRDFRKKISTLFSEEDADEVYQVAIQMYPLTIIESEEEK